MLDLSGIKILVVEDDEDQREILRRILEQFRAKVRVVANGEAALAAARDKVPDLILCDLKMPKMDGYEFIKQLRHDDRLSRIRAIAVSGFGTQAAIDRTWKAGFSGYLVKPVGFEILRVTLERIFWNRSRGRLLERR